MDDEYPAVIPLFLFSSRSAVWRLLQRRGCRLCPSLRGGRKAGGSLLRLDGVRNPGALARRGRGRHSSCHTGGHLHAPLWGQGARQRCTRTGASFFFKSCFLKLLLFLQFQVKASERLTFGLVNSDFNSIFQGVRGCPSRRCYDIYKKRFPSCI